MASRQLQSLDLETLTVRNIVPLKYDYVTYPSSYLFVTNGEGLLTAFSLEEYFSSFGVLLPSSIAPYLTDALISTTTSLSVSTVSSFAVATLSSYTESSFSTLNTLLFSSLNESIGSTVSSVLYLYNSAEGISSLSTTVGGIDAGPGVSSLSTQVAWKSTATLYNGFYDFVAPDGVTPYVRVGDFDTRIVGGLAVNKGISEARYTALDVSGNLYASGNIFASNFTTPSDSNLKTNILPVQNALSSMLEMNGVWFQWKASGLKDVGVIAQDTQSVIPEAVVERPDSTLTVNYDKFIPYLINSVKELHCKLESVEKELSELKRRFLCP